MERDSKYLKAKVLGLSKIPETETKNEKICNGRGKAVHVQDIIGKFHPGLYRAGLLGRTNCCW